jgi:hypothetical protein
LKQKNAAKQTHDELEAKRILDRVARDSETVGTSSMARTTELLNGNISSESADGSDPVEILGKKIGRTLGWIALLILGYYLFRTYIL